MGESTVKRVTVSTPLDGVTATTTSSALPMDNVTKATWVFTRADHSSGSTAFTVEVSADNSTWIGYNKLISNATNTNSQTLIRTAGPTLSSNTSETVTMDLEHDTFAYVRVTATETTDGTHTAKLIRQY